MTASILPPCLESILTTEDKRRHVLSQRTGGGYPRIAVERSVYCPSSNVNYFTGSLQTASQLMGQESGRDYYPIISSRLCRIVSEALSSPIRADNSHQLPSLPVPCPTFPSQHHHSPCRSLASGPPAQGKVREPTPANTPIRQGTSLNLLCHYYADEHNWHTICRARPAVEYRGANRLLVLTPNQPTGCCPSGDYCSSPSKPSYRCLHLRYT
jgi:hypothetical protein